MSCVVLSQRPLTTTGAWQRSLDELGFALRLEADAGTAIASLHGHLPAVWKEREAGFECYPRGTDAAADITEENEDLGQGAPWACAIEIVYWSSAGCAGAMMAAAAYARAVDGILYECEGGIVVMGDDIVPFARQSVAEMWAALVADGEA